MSGKCCTSCHLPVFICCLTVDRAQVLDILAGFYGLDRRPPSGPQHALRRASSWLQEQRGISSPL